MTPGPSEPGAWGAGALNNGQAVVCFLYNSVINEKETMGSPPPPSMNFIPTIFDSVCNSLLL